MTAPELSSYATVQRLADREILRLLKDAYKDINRDLQRLSTQHGVGAEIRRAQLQAVKKDILERQAQFFRDTGDVIAARRVEAAARAIRVAGRHDAAAFAAAGRAEDARQLARALEETELRSVDVAIARMIGSHIPLSRRVYRTQAWAGDQLERRINSGLARGLSAEEIARDIRQYVNPATPGGTRYAALRLARTEINNAFHAMSIRAAMLKPWIKKMEWHLSESHPKSRPDECDELDGRLFAPEDVPRKPHPMCMCFVVPLIDTEEQTTDQFVDDLLSGEFDDFLSRYLEPGESL